MLLLCAGNLNQMRHILFLFLLFSAFPLLAQKSSAQKLLEKLAGQGLNNDDLIAGLKEALNVGSQNAINEAAKGFLNNPEIRIPLPPEFNQVERTMRRMGQGKQIDDLITKMNQGATDAVMGAVPIFGNAIKGLSINDAVGLFQGGKGAITEFLRTTTSAALKSQFKPIIDDKLNANGTMLLLTSILTSYNRIPGVKKVTTDFAGYAADKTTDGLIKLLAKEEEKIRNDPSARTTELLKKVFGIK
jgi:hypothetical protein